MIAKTGAKTGRKKKVNQILLYKRLEKYLEEQNPGACTAEIAHYFNITIATARQLITGASLYCHSRIYEECTKPEQDWGAKFYVRSREE